MDSGRKPFSGVVQKLKKIKNIEVIVCIILLAIVLLIYSARGRPSDEPAAETQAVAVVEETLEDRLAVILSSIEGAGKVRVMITYDGSGETVTAVESKRTTTIREDTSGGAMLTTTTTEETDTPVFVGDGEGKPLIIKELSPSIVGVLIVAEGADNIKVRLELIRAAARALNIDAGKIEIFKMN